MTAIQDYVARVVATAPPLSPEQRDSLSAIIRRSRGQAPLPERKREPKPTSIYRHFDACGCLLYVGIAYDPVKRNYAHAGTSWWSKWTDHIQIAGQVYATRSAAVDAERDLIQTELPVFNKVHAFDRDTSVVRYLIQHERWEHLSVPTVIDTADLPGVLTALEKANLLNGVTWSEVPR